MKRIFAFVLALAMMPALCGCGSIYSNYQKVENLLVIQTLGIDYTPSGVDITLASASNAARGEGPTLLSGGGETVSKALYRIKSRSNEQALFFSHINSIVLGETAAQAGIEDYLTYICRSPYVRVDIPIYIIKGCSARETMNGVGSGTAGISELLQTIKESLDQSGGEEVIYAAEILRNDRRYGSALVCALSYEESSERSGGSSESGGGSGNGQGQEASPENTDQSGSGEGGEGKEQTAAAAGYAIIKNSRLCGYIGTEEAVGVGFIKNRVGVSYIVVKDMRGAPVTLEISGGGAEIEPLWGDDGSLLGIDVSAHVRASVIETAAGSGKDTPQYADYITSQLESAVSRRISAVLQRSRELQADFLGLAGIIELADPVRSQSILGNFNDLLPGLELQITVSGTLSHTNDIKDA